MNMTTRDGSLPGVDMLVTDAGLETWLLFQRGIDLPAFAAYPLAAEPAGRALLLEYYEHYLRIAAQSGAGLLLETATWRANPEWAATLGHDGPQLAELIDACVALVAGLRDGWQGPHPFVISGAIGPRGDGYVVGHTMDVDEASDYHRFQIERMSQAGVDVVTAMTMGYVEEGAGVVRAAQAIGVPSIISFTVETDGTLPSGITLAEAIERTDTLTDGGPLHYMVNCAHPTHFAHVFDDGDWVRRIGGVRANASSLSHAELDEMVELDAGDPADLADRYVGLTALLPSMRVVGGCCGTDERHVEAIVHALRSAGG